MLIGKSNALIWFYCMKKDEVKIRERQGAEGTHLSESQKTHPTGEFGIVASNENT